MRKLLLLSPALLLLACGGGGTGTVQPTNTLVGGTWRWSFYETDSGTRTGCTALPTPNPCAQTWSFSTLTLIENGQPYTLSGNALTFYNGDGTVDESSAFRWINANEFAERRAGNPDWEIWVRTP